MVAAAQNVIGTDFDLPAAGSAPALGVGRPEAARGALSAVRAPPAGIAHAGVEGVTAHAVSIALAVRISIVSTAAAGCWLSVHGVGRQQEGELLFQLPLLCIKAFFLK